MSDHSSGSQRSRDRAVPGSSYRPPARARFAAYLVVIVVVMVAAIMIPQSQLSWTWVFPFAAAACSVYGYLRVRKARTLVQGSAWTLAQVVFALGAFALIAIPAKS